MSRAAARPPSTEPGLLRLAAEAEDAVGALVTDAANAVQGRVCANGKISAELLEREQHAAHGLAWLATYVEVVRQLSAYARRMCEAGRFGETERLLVTIGLGETLAQIFGGIPMSQGETVRLASLGLADDRIEQRRTNAVKALIAEGTAAPARAKLVDFIKESQGSIGDDGLDETLDAMRKEMRRFADAEVLPHAHGWHLKNQYTLGTRSEIAAELILASGTDAQKKHWLPKIASGEALPTAVFTEPNTGSDLASLKTRAVREGGVYKVYGNKTWITHPVRADLMTLLVRTDPDESGYKGLSMLLAPKPRGTDQNPFPAPGMTGGEIEVLGYRGMKEFEIGFDGFEVPVENLLGGAEGQGFKQLMQTFEAARIQTAARAVGVAQSAMELALRYAQERLQFGKPTLSFPRVSDKIAMMAVEIMIARQLTYHAAREKDSGRRCDLEAGMAKLYAARVAWAAADNAVQIHGGNGFALEYPVSRVLCDARILNIFEGAAEIQAQVIARRLLDGSN